MDEHAGVTPTAPVSTSSPPQMNFGDFMSVPDAPLPETFVSPLVSAGKDTLVPSQPTAETPAGPLFVEGGPGRPPMSLRTPGEVVEAAARVSRREAEVSAREARAAERESAFAVAEAAARTSRDARAASTLAVAAEADSAATAASDVHASNLAVAANLDRRETALRARELALAERERSTTAVAIAERERVAASREAAANVMADDARRRVDALEARERECDAREAELETRERVLRDLAAVTRAREAACASREARLGEDEFAARASVDSAIANGNPAADSEAAGNRQALEVDGVTSARTAASANTTELALRKAAAAESERAEAVRAAAADIREAALLERERELRELHDAVEKRQAAVAEVGTARAAALEAIQIDLERRERALETREAEAGERCGGWTENVSRGRNEIVETREVASKAMDVVKEMERVISEQRTLLDVAAKDREALTEEMSRATLRLVSLEREKAEGADLAAALREALSKCESEREEAQFELEKAKRRATLSGHVAGSVGEYVRAVAVEKDRIAVLEKEKAILRRELSEAAEAASQIAVEKAKEAAVALAEVATASVKAELDAVRLELAAAKRGSPRIASPPAARLGGAPAPPAVSGGSASPAAAASSPELAARPKPPVRERDGMTPEKRAGVAERAARSLVDRVRVSAERRVEEATRDAREAKATAARLREDLAMCRAELDAAVGVAARAEASMERFGSIGGSSASASRIARLDAAVGAACSTLEALSETAAMAPVGGWLAVSEALEAPMETTAILERFAIEACDDDSPAYPYGRAGSNSEMRMFRAVRDVVAAVREAAAVAAAAEEGVSIPR